MPAQFPAVLGHKDAVFTVPVGTTLLASSKKCPIQAFRYGKAIYGLQFHAEFVYEDLLWRLSLGSNASYRERSTFSGEKFDIDTRKIVKNFINL
jgi:GMP synthase (glutamine-hydrolysing)